MGILACYGEDLDFPNGNPVTVTTTGGHFRAGYARCAISQATTSLLSKSKAFPGGAVTSAWITFRGYVGSNVPSYWSHRLFGLGKSGSTNGLWIGNTAAACNKLGLYSSDGSAETLLASSSGVVWAGYALVKVDIQVVNFGASATVNVYFDNVLVLAAGPVDTRVGGMTDFDSIFLAFGTVAYCDLQCSEIIVADEDTRLFSSVTLAPSGAGDANTFTSGGYGDIDEVSLSDADTAYSATPGQVLQVGLSNLPSGSFVVKAVGISARLSDGVGGMAMKMGVKTNGVVHLGSPITLAPAWETDQALLAGNPETLNVFTPAEVNALQLAFESAAA